jgi:hypothetical protein
LLLGSWLAVPDFEPIVASMLFDEGAAVIKALLAGLGQGDRVLLGKCPCKRQHAWCGFLRISACGVRLRSVFCSIHGSALSGSIQAHGSLPEARVCSLSAMACSDLWRPARSTQRVSATVSEMTVPFRQFEVQGRLDEFLWHIKQLDRQRAQLFDRPAAVPPSLASVSA